MKCNGLVPSLLVFVVIPSFTHVRTDIPHQMERTSMLTY